ncbi:hypothetical protein P2H44_00475 [Albimonas sp. CAU 1670]|uniref:hypothetical protein n=1 Tax=Albimonas sp. CAU 1670 TaxID=3032599 RepID=UPI0023DC2102|nr:hypothetical protein [Albimonas sp. CAU 1670]MDF2231018.1 hypothetical protein [Albimonas sp. CAU 1670]
MQDTLSRPDPAPREAPPWTTKDEGVLIVATLAIVMALAVLLPGTEAARRLWPAAHDWLNASPHRAGALAAFAPLFGAGASLLLHRLPDAPRKGDARGAKPTLKDLRILALLFGGCALVFWLVYWGPPRALGEGDGSLPGLLARLGSIPVGVASQSLGGLMIGACTLAMLRHDRATRAAAYDAAAEWHGPKGT